MFKSLPLISAVLGLLAFSPAAFAQPGNGTACKAGQPGCAQGQKTQAKSSAPKVGQSAKSGAPYQRSTNSRFSAPPKGQEYRVVNDNIVLTDSKTKKIVKVLGPRSSLEK